MAGGRAGGRDLGILEKALVLSFVNHGEVMRLAALQPH